MLPQSLRSKRDTVFDVGWYVRVIGAVGRSPFLCVPSRGFHETGGCGLELLIGRELRDRTWLELAVVLIEIERVWVWSWRWWGRQQAASMCVSPFSRWERDLGSIT